MVAPRPLDPMHSIKAKLGVLVAVSVAVSALAVWYGLVDLGWRPRYTLPVAVLLALGVTQLLARGMTSPLRSMTAAARAMARGDYSRRVQTTSRDEVGELARAFNRMAADLEVADRERRDLVANVSHELRTPISALQAIMENLVDGVAKPDPATLRAALAQTERLGRLVRELLDLARIDSGTEPLDRRDVEIALVLDDAVAEAAMTGRNVRFAVDVSPPGARAWADGARLHQVLANLLDNAARHSPPGGTVRVSARSGPAGLHSPAAGQLGRRRARRRPVARAAALLCADWNARRHARAHRRPGQRLEHRPEPVRRPHRGETGSRDYLPWHLTFGKRDISWIHRRDTS
jgi:signal transduction histidine kinase